MVERFILRQDSLVYIYLSVAAPHLLMTGQDRIGFIQILNIEDIFPVAAPPGFKVGSPVNRPI